MWETGQKIMKRFLSWTSDGKHWKKTKGMGGIKNLGWTHCICNAYETYKQRGGVAIEQMILEFKGNAEVKDINLRIINKLMVSKAINWTSSPRGWVLRKEKNFDIKNDEARASLVAQWLRICLPMQGTRVGALVREDPTCCGATKPVRHNYWVCALDPASHNYWAHVPQLLKSARLEPVLRNKRSHHNEKPTHRNEE